MAVEETAGAASSAAVENPKFTQFDGWDDEGTPVVTKKAETSKEKPAAAGKPEDADAATADTSKETNAEDAARSAANKTQESRRKPDAEARIKELAARTKQLEKDLAEARKPKTPAGESETKEAKAESSTAKAAEKPGTPPPTRPKPVLGDKGPDGKAKYESFDAYNEDLVEWRIEQKFAAQERVRQQTQQQESLGKHLEEARGRYADFDTVTKPLIAEMLKPDIPREVFAVINDSPVLADLLYTLGGTEATKADFLDVCRTNPGKALRVALLMEQEIAKELGKGKTGAKKAGEGETEAAPAVKPPRAPKPPSEVGGRGAPGEDALVSAAKANDFRSFEAEQTRRAMASRR